MNIHQQMGGLNCYAKDIVSGALQFPLPHSGEQGSSRKRFYKIDRVLGPAFPTTAKPEL